jgi:hypothetical protein
MASGHHARPSSEAVGGPSSEAVGGREISALMERLRVSEARANSLQRANAELMRKLSAAPGAEAPEAAAAAARAGFATAASPASSGDGASGGASDGATVGAPGGHKRLRLEDDSGASATQPTATRPIATDSDDSSDMEIDETPVEPPSVPDDWHANRAALENYFQDCILAHTHILLEPVHIHELEWPYGKGRCNPFARVTMRDTRNGEEHDVIINSGLLYNSPYHQQIKEVYDAAMRTT